MCLFSGILCVYLPVSVAGFIIYGSDVNSNILQSIPNGALRTTAEIFITFNVMFAFLIVLNPFSQDMEELFGIPHSKYCEMPHMPNIRHLPDATIEATYRGTGE